MTKYQGLLKSIVLAFSVSYKSGELLIGEFALKTTVGAVLQYILYMYYNLRCLPVELSLLQVLHIYIAS